LATLKDSEHGYFLTVERIKSPEKRFADFETVFKLTTNKSAELLNTLVYAYIFFEKDSKLFSEKINAILPRHQDLYLIDFDDISNEEVQGIFDVIERFGYKAVYEQLNSGLFFGTNETGEVFLFNNTLINYLIENGADETNLPELSLKVADNLNEFANLYDKGLVPLDFHKYYQGETKIINESNFDIYAPKRKIFIKPFIFEISDDSQKFYTYTESEGGPPMIQMDKIRQGENLEATLNRVLKELGLPGEFIGALVGHNFEYDKDNQGRIVPRLIVNVYINDLPDREFATKHFNGNFTPQESI